QEERIEIKSPHQPLANRLIGKITIGQKNNGGRADRTFFSKNRQTGQKADPERETGFGLLFKATQKNEKGSEIKEHRDEFRSARNVVYRLGLQGMQEKQGGAEERQPPPIRIGVSYGY